MSILNCSCRRDCTLWAVIASIIIGVVVAFLQITATITIAPAALIVAFGIAVGYLGAILYVSTRTDRQRISNCLCSAVAAVLAGVLGTVLSSVILLGITFAATSVIGAIIAGILAASFALILSATACLIKCLTDCTE